jgi:Flavodoxin domain
MKSTVTYFSQSGNTQKVAEAIADALPGDVTFGELASVPAAADADVVFVGMPIVRFGPPEEVRDYLRRDCAGRDVALFVTHAAPEDINDVQPWLEACRDAASGCRLVGFFHCQGRLAEPVRQWMAASGMPDMVRFADMAHLADGQPDASRLASARAFAESVATGFDTGDDDAQIA